MSPKRRAHELTKAIRSILDRASSEELVQILATSSSAPAGAMFVLGHGGREVQAPVAVVIEIATNILEWRRPAATAGSSARDVINTLFQAAAADPPPNPDGRLNISSWVGVRTPAWYAVFSYSSPEPSSNEPWFCSLDREAQRLVLLLVGLAMETEHCDPRTPELKS